MAAKASLKFARIQPRKMRLATQLVAGKPLAEAETTLSLLPNRAGRVLGQVLRSAAANAENNHEMNRDALYVLTATADQGPSFGRMKPRARGRADVIRRRMTHVTVLLEERGAERSGA